MENTKVEREAGGKIMATEMILMLSQEVPEEMPKHVYNSFKLNYD